MQSCIDTFHSHLLSTWSYDTAPHGIGKLATVTAGNGYARNITYDAYGRASREASTLDVAYTLDKTYDAYGRVSQITYPTGFAVRNAYNAYDEAQRGHILLFDILFEKLAICPVPYALNSLRCDMSKTTRI